MTHKSFALAFSLFLFSMMQVCCAGSDTAVSVKQSLNGLYEKRNVALAKKDLKSAAISYSPEFVFVSKAGAKGDLKTLQKQLFAYVAFMKTVKVKTSIVNCSLKGKVATLMVKYHLDLTIENSDTKKVQKVAADEVSEDLWEKGASGWLQKRMTVKKEAALIDGKPIDNTIMGKSKVM